MSLFYIHEYSKKNKQHSPTSLDCVTGYDLFPVSLDEHRQKLDDLKSKYDEFESKLQSIQSELETATQRIVELEAKDNLTFVEREELDKLKETNAELKRQQDLLEQSKKLAHS